MSKRKSDIPNRGEHCYEAMAFNHRALHRYFRIHTALHCAYIAACSFRICLHRASFACAAGHISILAKQKSEMTVEKHMSLDKLRAKRDEQAQAAERAGVRAQQAKARLQMTDNRLSTKRKKLYDRERILAGIAILEAVKKHRQWEWWAQVIEASTLRPDEKQVLETCWRNEVSPGPPHPRTTRVRRPLRHLEPPLLLADRLKGRSGAPRPGHRSALRNSIRPLRGHASEYEQSEKTHLFLPCRLASI